MTLEQLSPEATQYLRDQLASGTQPASSLVAQPTAPEGAEDKTGSYLAWGGIALAAAVGAALLYRNLT